MAVITLGPHLEGVKAEVLDISSCLKSHIL